MKAADVICKALSLTHTRIDTVFTIYSFGALMRITSFEMD